MTGHLNFTDHRVLKRWEKWHRRELYLLCPREGVGTRKTNKSSKGLTDDVPRGKKIFNGSDVSLGRVNFVQLATTSRDWREVAHQNSRQGLPCKKDNRTRPSIFPSHWNWAIHEEKISNHNNAIAGGKLQPLRSYPRPRPIICSLV